MNTLTEISLALPEMPGFNDGMVDMGEPIRTMAESLVNEIMSAQADIMCEEQGNSRNGYRERTLITSVGPISMRIPKVRMGSWFPDGLIERYSRTDRAVIGAVSEMVAKGVSTRKVERIASRMGISKVFPSRKSLIRFAGAVLAEPSEQWSGRRWFSQESTDEVLDKAKPAPEPAYEDTAAELARRIIALIVADRGKAA